MIQPVLTNLLLLPVFLFLSILILYFPGRLLISRLVKDIEPSVRLVLSFTTGIIIFIVIAIILGLVQLRFLSYPLFLVVTVISIKKHWRSSLKDLKNLFTEKAFVLLLFLGIVAQGFINFPSGLKYSDGIHFWSAQGHDGLWHVALMEEIVNNFPPANPLYAGYPIQNYHYTSDILMGEFYRIFPFFSSLDLYFRFFPVLFSFLIGLSVYALVVYLYDKRSAYWAMFFTYLCGSFGYLYLIKKGQFPLGGETVFWASQGNTILGNPPHTVGIIILTVVLLTLAIYLKEKKSSWLWLSLLLGFMLSTIKVSAGSILVGMVGVFAIMTLIIRKDIKPLLLSVAFAVTNFSALRLIAPNAGSFLVFEPLWFPRTMMVAKLDNVDWELRRQHYLSINLLKSWLRVIQLEVQAVLIFIFGNLGMRFIGLCVFLALLLKRKLSPLDYAVAAAAIAPIVIVLIFVQSGITYNLIQFIQITLHLLGIYAGIGVAFLLSKSSKPMYRYSLSFIIVLLSIPTVVGNIIEFYGPGHNALAKVTNSELAALTWINNNTDPNSIILTRPFSTDYKYQYTSQPIPISAWYGTPYVYVFSGRYTYMSGEEQLRIIGFDVEPKLDQIRSFFNQKDLSRNQEFLKNSEVDYVYIYKDQQAGKLINLSKFNLKQVYDNDEVVIYKHEKNS